MADFEKFKFYRDQFKVDQVNLEQIELKTQDIHRARHYIYQKGEAEKISNKKFDRAIKDGNLHIFPNVSFFCLKKEAELNRLKTIEPKTEIDRQAVIA